MAAFSLLGGRVLIGNGLEEASVHCGDGLIASDSSARAIDARGYLVLPGLVDLHGDGFEHHLAPRKGAIKDLAGGLGAAHAEIAANGITTAVMAQFYSWEGGMRGPEFAAQVFDLLSTAGATYATDLIPQLRFEYLMRDDWAEVLELVRHHKIPYVAMNDHVPHDALRAGKKPPRLTGQALKAKRSPDTHWALLQQMHDGLSRARAEMAGFVHDIRAAGAVIASHDDADATTRAFWADVGVEISEFPETQDAAQAAIGAGTPVIMGAPNVLRGASHKGNVSALDLVEAGLCTALASDYHYPSLLRAAFIVGDRIGLARAWDLVSAGPARVLGRDDRGALDIGKCADMIVVHAETKRIEGVFAKGRPTYLTGDFAARLLAD